MLEFGKEVNFCLLLTGTNSLPTVMCTIEAHVNHMIKKILLTWLVAVFVGELLLFTMLLVIVQPGNESRLHLSIGAFAYTNAVFAPVIVVLTFLVSIVTNLFASRIRK
ncbi:MAG: hypothetical protein HC853_06490 [Anaerolineae bacterium]|nr:hypothetical protein [Anaerolineae bacterium]